MPNNIQPGAEAQEYGNPALSVLSILRTIWKRKLRIGLVWVTLSVCAFVVVKLLPSVYHAEAVIVIDSQKIPEKFVTPTVASDLEDRIASIRQTLLSGGQLKKIMDEFGLYKNMRKDHFEEEVLETMRNDITITVEPLDTGLVPSKAPKSKLQNPGIAFRIGYDGPDAQLVARVANRLTDLYVEENLKTRESQAAGTSAFLDTQLKDSKKRLDELEAAVSKYKSEHNGELPQQEHSLTAALSRLQTALEVNRDAINRAQQTRVILESNLSAMEATTNAQVQAWAEAQKAAEGGASGAVDQTGRGPTPTKKASDTLQEQLAVLRARYSETHPDVVRLKADIERVKKLEEDREAAAAQTATTTATSASKAPNAAPAGGKATQRADAKTVVREPAELLKTREQVAGLRSQIRGSDKELQDRTVEQQRILHDIDEYQRRIERLPLREQDMAQITRDYEMSKANYKSLLDNKMSAEMALDMERRQQSERFTVMDRAQVPEKPIKPKRPMLYAIGSALGLMVALIWSFSAEMRKNVILGEWELPEGTPVLARLPAIAVSARGTQPPNRAGRRWFGRKKVFAEAPVG